MTASDSYDVLIVGGGLVGASLACALDGAGLRSAMVEAQLPGKAAPSFDERNLALARASLNALDALGVLALLETAPSPIRRIHVSSRGEFGALRLDADRYGVDVFGAVVIARELGAALEARLDRLRELDRLRPARLVSLSTDADGATAALDTADGARTLRARVVVGADGTGSAVREALGITAQRHDYAQRLFVAVATVAREHGGVAYERFTADGPVALLPLSGRRVGTVCTVSADEASRIAALDDDGYRDFLQDRFGHRLGRFARVGRRSAYPLALVTASRLHGRRGVVIGNAAQTLHPVAAQGFNLGLRDALTLAEELTAAHARGKDVGADAVLARHAARRAPDREQTLRFSDGLARLMTRRGAPVALLRSLGLVALDRVPGAAAGLVRGAMGFRGDVPRLAFAGSSAMERA